ncbi:hypothetical protein GCM10009602_70580 [Nocardiopsis tropica]
MRRGPYGHPEEQPVSAIVDVHLPGDTPPKVRPRPAAEAPDPAPSPRRASRRSGTGHPEQHPVCACQWGPTTHPSGCRSVRRT